MNSHKFRAALAGLSFFFFLSAILPLGSVFIWRIFEPQLGNKLSQPVGNIFVALAIIIAVIFVEIILVYTAVVTWLFFARFFFSKSEILAVAKMGSTSRFDRWLINFLIPD